MKSKLFSVLGCFILIMTALGANEVQTATETKATASLHFSSKREDDLNFILEQHFLKCDILDKIAPHFAAQALIKNNKEMPMSELLDRLRQNVDSIEVRRQFMQPFQLFSDEEIHQLRQIFEKDVYIKFINAAFPINKSIFDTLDNLLNSIIQQCCQQPAEEKACQKETEGVKNLELTQDNFQKEVEQAIQPVIIDAYTHWCGPCRAFAPNFEAMHHKYQDSCKFAKIDGDQQPQLVDQLKIECFPTILFLYKGKILLRQEGFMTAEEFESKIEEFLKQIN